MKKLLIALFIFGGVFTSSAQNINEYKYILIPETFEFTGEVNQYQLNSLFKFLFEQEGFNTVMKSADKPQDLAVNSCLGLKANLKNNSGLFVTKLVIELEDCQGKVVFKSKEGRSREKDFKLAYHEALKDAFTSVEELDYEYVPGETSVVNNSNEMNSAKETVKVTLGAEVAANPVNTDTVAEENIETTTPAPKTGSEMKYLNAGKTFFLKKTSQGYNLFQEGSTEPIAILLESEGGKSFIYNSLTKQGIGYFDAENNLMVEYFDREKNNKVTLKYEVMD
ncbi:hypothetical protein G3I01_07610 [Gramella sp. MT6]|uniref:hypothetical protein n=1 Tax=Gramella sp. MT6 TaxID=2705471 RepID=UPI001C5DC42E|nr:hypothetical protein [Gramella sp. MT6]QYA25377.1 hypothetical protein G3I01_07610 [Gramella sp. MT6]